jgi:tRNA G10  N-methylase Trm11
LKYAFVLGTNHSLCKVEIVTVLKNKDIKFEVLAASEEILLLEIESEITLDINDFGSTAKIIKIIKEIDYQDLVKEEIIGRDLENWVDPTLKNLTYGISIYNGGGKFKQLNELFYLSFKLSQKIKEELRSWGIKSGCLAIKERALSTVSVNINLLKKSGTEFVFISGKDKVWGGKTISVQDYEGYSKRDYGRPARDDKSGMTPPKLAKIMINLADQTRESFVADPFCGSGTFLGEMILLGFNKIWGSDISTKAIGDSKQNIDWLMEEFKIDKDKIDLQIRVEDATEISKKIGLKQVNAIVCEPYLGSNKLRSFNERKIENEIKYIEDLYLKTFLEFKKILKYDGKIVIIFPVINYKGKNFHLNILGKIRELGFHQSDYCEKQDKLGLNLTKRKTIVYYRPKQTVIREILIFSL